MSGVEQCEGFEVLAGRRLIPVSSTSQFRTLRLLPGGHYPQGVNVHPVTNSRTVAFPQLILVSKAIQGSRKSCRFTYLGRLPGRHPDSSGLLVPYRLRRSVGPLPHVEACPYVPRVLACTTSIPDCQARHGTWPDSCRTSLVPAREPHFHSLRVGFPESYPVVCH